MTSLQKYQNQLEAWDQWIRDGQVGKVQRLLHTMNHKKVPRALLADYAQIARRVGAPGLIVLWLNPIVRSEKLHEQNATEKEKAIYAAGLLRLGAFQEAEKILKDLDSQLDPQINFYRASLNLNQWNYESAIPHLRKYCSDRRVSAYQKFVGRLNLCASLVAVQDLSKAEHEIESLLKKLIQEGHLLLLGNLYEIRSQFFFFSDQHQNALKDLDESTRLLKKADPRSLLYVDKWKWIIRTKAGMNKNLAFNELQNLKQRAVAAKDWETIRDCDRHWALTYRDKELLLKVYWGSSSRAYKMRVLSLYGEELDLNESFTWRSRGSESSIGSKSKIDLTTKAPTQLLQLLFFTLSKEMYRPLPITELLSAIYPNEFFNPISGPMKMNRLVSRARIWLQLQGAPVEIRSYRNSFKLEFTADCEIEIYKDLPPRPLALVPNGLNNEEYFSTADWAQAHKISTRSARRQILSLVRIGKINSYIRGPKTQYRLK